jgi:hypothetical protein
MVREKKTADEILDFTDKELLQKGMGFSEKETKMARSIWHKLMGRRLNRETLEKAAPERKLHQTGGESQSKANSVHYKQLNFLELFDQYAYDAITENAMVGESVEEYGKPDIDESKNVLISLVKKDNEAYFLDGELSKIYYTGKRFPSTVALNKLYYFMPYFKGKGVRDLYLIKIARVGTRKEGQPDNDPKDFRLVFEIEFVCELFSDYQMVDLEIWHTFTDTTMSELQKKLR